MEILSSSTNVGFTWFVVIFISLACIGLLLASFTCYWTAISDEDGNAFASGVLFTLTAIALACLVFTIVGRGPTTTYKATVTDFNEVYEQRYEIVGQDGEIYLLQKKEAE